MRVFRAFVLGACLLGASSPAFAQSFGGGAGGTPGPAANSSNLSGCVYLSGGVSPTSVIPQVGLQCDSSGNLDVNVKVGTSTVTPTSTTSTPASVTLGSAGTFQSVLSASVSRRGCTIQNTSTDTEYLFVGANASATTATSLQLTPGQSLNCASGLILITDNISMAGKVNSSDTAVVVAQ